MKWQIVLLGRSSATTVLAIVFRQFDVYVNAAVATLIKAIMYLTMHMP
jgi:hypothetical protein